MNNKNIFLGEPDKTFTYLKSCSPKVSQLYVRGNHIEVLGEKYNGLRVGIIGTRDATQAGKNDARKIAQVVCNYGGVVVSGMALGIDGAAHQGAIDVNGLTIAVLGSGLDQIYPTKHTNLFHKIINNGAVISEYDLQTKPLAWHFPIRNRIIAALSDVIVVPEGTIRGGARITVDLALAMGKPVCAIPGSIRNRSSELPNSIIKDGATCILDPSDLIYELGMPSNPIGWQLQTNKTESKYNSSILIDKVLANIAQKAMQKTEISHITGCSISQLSGILKQLENANKIRFKRGLYEIA